VVQKSTAAALDFAAVMAHASVVLRPYSRYFPGLSDSLTRSAMYAWRWARAHPDSMYDQQRINRLYSPQISTGEYGDRSVADEFQWAASELFLATKADSFLTVAAPLARTPIAAPAWNYVAPLGVYSLVEHRRDLPRGFDTTALVRRLLDAADTLAARARNSAYRVPIGSVWDWVWGSNAVAANQGMLLVEAYRATNRVEYLDAANAALDYLVGRNAMSQSFVTAFGARMPKFPHHRPSATDGIAPPVPGMLVGGPNPGQEDKCPNYPSKLPARSYVDDVCSYASNEVAINWNAPFAFLAGALDAYRARTGVVQAGERR
jgi:endoglucanase